MKENLLFMCGCSSSWLMACGVDKKQDMCGDDLCQLIIVNQ